MRCIDLIEITTAHTTGAASCLLTVRIIRRQVLVVSAPEEVQRARVLGRPNMQALPAAEAEAKLDSILSKQMPDMEKRARADVVINTGTTMEATRRAVSRPP